MTFRQTRLKTSAEGIEGEVSPAQGEGGGGSLPHLRGAGRPVTRLTWQPLPGAQQAAVSTVAA